MNKTVSVNISGLVFNIEEVAYERLRRYLDTIKGYFQDAEGMEEIMSDIEARIAELFQEKVKGNKEVINDKDVEEVIATLGEPEEYVDTEDTYQRGTQSRSFNGRKRRVFRNVDNRVIGGVCSGVSAHFDWDPVWLRLLFGLSLFVGGFGLILYIVLWAIIPAAKTTAEKIEMQGEPVNVENIKKKINEERDHIKSRFSKFRDDFNDIDTHPHTQKVKTGIEQFFSFLGNVIGLAIKSIGKILGFALLVFGIFMVVSLASLVIGSETLLSISPDGLQFFSLPDLSSVIFSSEDQATMALTGALLVLLIPVLCIIYAGLKLLFRIRLAGWGVGITLLSLWVIGLIIVVVSGLQLGKQFNTYAEVEKELPISQPLSDTLYLDILDDTYFSNYFEDHDDNWIELIKIEEKQIVLGYPYLDIIKNSSDTFQIKVIQSARGPGQKIAINRAEAISYNYRQNGSSLQFAPYFTIDKTEKLRAQHLKVIVKVPEGKAVFLGEKADRIIYDIKNVSRTLDDRMVNKTWTMTAEGLSCLGCDPEEL